MQAYKKRTKGNWKQGKGAKGDGEERQYARREIVQMLRELHADYREQYRKAGRTPNLKARLEYRICWYEEVLARHGERSDSFHSYMRDGLIKAKARLKNLK